MGKWYVEAMKVRSREGLFVEALLELRLLLSVLNRRIAGEVGLNDVDLDCLEIVSRTGPTSPARLCRRLGLHPATMTGILTRLERSGWIERAADPADRRVRIIKVAEARRVQLARRYAPASRVVLAALSNHGARDTDAATAVLRDIVLRGQGVAVGRKPQKLPGQPSTSRRRG